MQVYLLPFLATTFGSNKSSTDKVLENLCNTASFTLLSVETCPMPNLKWYHFHWHVSLIRFKMAVRSSLILLVVDILCSAGQVI